MVLLSYHPKKRRLTVKNRKVTLIALLVDDMPVLEDLVKKVEVKLRMLKFTSNETVSVLERNKQNVSFSAP